jgi:hypothetical protein
MTEDQLLTHARRCYSLAEVCLDPVVSKKFRALGHDYLDYVRRNADRSAEDAPELLPPRAKSGKPVAPR